MVEHAHHVVAPVQGILGDVGVVEQGRPALQGREHRVGYRRVQQHLQPVVLLLIVGRGGAVGQGGGGPDGVQVGPALHRAGRQQHRQRGRQHPAPAEQGGGVLPPGEDRPPEPPQPVPQVGRRQPVEGIVHDAPQPLRPRLGHGVEVGGVLGGEEQAEHAKGNPFQIGIFTGASTGDSCDGILSRAKAIRYRAPYTTNSDFRKAVNSGEIAYNDIHLSQMAQEVRYGFMGKVNIAIIEACEVTPDGKIYLTAAGGIAPTVCRLADQIIVELNAAHSKNAMGLHDVYEPLDPPYRREIPIYKPSDRIGQPYIQVDPKKIVGVVETNWPDEARSFAEADPLTDKIGQNVADFLAADMKRGIIPSTFLPLQSGVGNIANAVLGALGRDKTIPAFEMYTEVIQNSVIGLIRDGRVKFGSACSLTVTNDCLQGIYDDMDFFRDKLVLRPSEISNSPEVVRRLGVISINTAIEADLYGNVNSTHIGGTKMMNGIGGSGDFTRNAYISIFTCPSVAKEGKISAIVPMVSHHDHTEHDVNIIITEQGVADLRGKSPKERAQAIIENCVHPDYKNILWDYLKITDGKSQTPQAVRAALAMHAELAKSGDMKNVDWAQYK